jgi:hypothetical protein
VSEDGAAGILIVVQTVCVEPPFVLVWHIVCVVCAVANVLLASRAAVAIVNVRLLVTG